MGMSEDLYHGVYSVVMCSGPVKQPWKESRADYIEEKVAQVHRLARNPSHPTMFCASRLTAFPNLRTIFSALMWSRKLG